MKMAKNINILCTEISPIMHSHLLQILSLVPLDRFPQIIQEILLTLGLTGSLDVAELGEECECESLLSSTLLTRRVACTCYYACTV